MTAAGQRLPRVVAGALALAGLTLVVSAGLIWGAGGFQELPTSFARGFLAVAAGMLAAVSYLGAGWLLASRIPQNPVGWLLLVMGLVFAVMAPTALLVDTAHHTLRPAPPATLAVAWVVSSFSGPIVSGAGISTGLLFPDGRFAGRRRRWGLALTVVGATLLAIGTALRPAGLLWYPSLPNPLAAPSELRPLVSTLMAAATLSLVAGALIMVLSLVDRYRRGDTTLRAQLRWILCAGIALAAALVPLLIVRFVLSVGEALGEVMVSLVDATAALLPIAATVAIMRYRLFGIDVIIGRTLVYVPMMAILGGMYTASIAIFQRIFVAVTGQASDAALVITIFLVAAAFTPIRRGLEAMVDRWTHAASPSGPGAGGATHEMDPSVAEVAARVVALRRLEARVATRPEPLPSSATRRRLVIDADGRVACPGGGAPHFVACLSCQDLAALITAPPTVVCTRGG